MQRLRIGVFFLFVICCLSCKKKAEPLPVEPKTSLTFSIGYTTDNGSFQTNAYNYLTPAGYTYDITKIEYYLSNITLIKPDSSLVLLKDFQYVNAAVAETNQMNFNSPPTGNFIGVLFNIGLSAALNTTGALPSTADNINMQWPDPMGGGYHFLKFEGHYKDAGQIIGFAMHLGTNKCLIPVKLYKEISIASGSSVTVTVTMNTNSWFRYPNLYDFNKDGNYIMGNDTAMLKIAENGKHVFSL